MRPTHTVYGINITPIENTMYGFLKNIVVCTYILVIKIIIIMMKMFPFKSNYSFYALETEVFSVLYIFLLKKVKT